MTATAEYEKAKQTPPRRGDIVRVTIEGPAKGCWKHPDIRSGESIRVTPEDKVTVEIIAPKPVEPAWWPPEVGDVIRVAVTTYLVTPKGARYVDTGKKAGLDAGDDRTFTEWLHAWGEKPFLGGSSSWDRMALLVRDGLPFSAAQS